MENKDLAIEEELKKFNWGAAQLGLIWSIVNGCFKKWFVNSLVASFIAGIGGMLLYLLCVFVLANFLGFMSIMVVAFCIPVLAILGTYVYIGKKGNRWAWESDSNTEKDIVKFSNTQKKWGAVA